MDSSRASAGGAEERILVVDETEAIRRLIEISLRSLGFVALAANREEAETILQSYDVILAVTDLGLRYLGYEWVDQLIGRGIATVVLTSYVLPTQIDAINPAAEVLAKPFSPSELRETAAELLGREV